MEVAFGPEELVAVILCDAKQEVAERVTTSRNFSARWNNGKERNDGDDV